MKFIALLRGINAGKNRWVEMKKLKIIFEFLGFMNVLTYINSGIVIFESSKSKTTIQREIESIFKKEFDFEIPTLIKTKREMKIIGDAIPDEWQNDAKQRTDVAYLFKKADSKKILNDLPVNRKYIDVRYIKGAVFWNLDRKNRNKSRLGKLIGHNLYQLMTVRNVNTARFLAGHKG
jgi:uncharacterized protein (DUF1697 family)